MFVGTLWPSPRVSTFTCPIGTVTPCFTAGIDAWWIEPVRHHKFSMNFPFLDLPNVIGSPHNSAGGGVWRDVSLRRAVANCKRALLGETPLHLARDEERMR